MAHPEGFHADDEIHKAFCGRHTAEVYERGGVNLVGELAGVFRVQWQRIRDQISTANLSVSVTECCDVLEQIEPVAFELHIFRDSELVWCGPITRMEFEFDSVDIYAEDMLWVAKRRALDTNFDLRSYPQNPDAPVGVDNSLEAVPFCVDLLTTHCYLQWGDEWNMAGRVIAVQEPVDCGPRTAMQVNAWSDTIWSIVDRVAEDQGMDYTVVGRDIYLFDNNLNFDEIEPLDEGDVSDYPRVVEYGNALATRYFRTNGSGFAGYAIAPVEITDRYAVAIDVISNENSQAELAESFPPPPPSPTTLKTWTRTAQRRIANSYPVGRSIVIPANSTLMPTSPWNIATLRPGVWFEVNLSRLCRGAITEYNRLHELVVTEDGEEGENVRITAVQPPAYMILPTDAPCDPDTGTPAGG